MLGGGGSVVNCGASLAEAPVRAAAPLMSLRNLRKVFTLRRGLLQRAAGEVRAVDDVTFDIGRGETVGLVGESGSGKSTLARMIVRLSQPTSGSVLLEGRDFAQFGRSDTLGYRRAVQMIFQDPYSSLNPRITAGSLIAEPLRLHGLAGRRQAADRAAELAVQVGLRPDALHRYPHEFSGGQRQRVAIARALAVSPRLIVADEPVSALDVSIRAQVLNLMADLQAERHLSYLLISHDIAVVAYLSQRIAVMYQGALVELGPTHDVLRQPLHPYTELLLEAVPAPHPRLRRARTTGFQGEPRSDTAGTNVGCRFSARCPIAVPRCRTEAPELRSVTSLHRVACHLR
jgi:peptide/nickel transport system ATP-binding protein/oligopeptide transport system ATP-binding protein